MLLGFAQLYPAGAATTSTTWTFGTINPSGVGLMCNTLSGIGTSQFKEKNASGVAIITLPQVNYTPPPSGYFGLSGAAALTFHTANSGTISFDEKTTQSFPTVFPFSNYTQKISQAGHYLAVSFIITLGSSAYPGQSCKLPISAEYRQ
jgi:hypothetical protein